MKKLFLFAAAALALAACSNDELNLQDEVRANSKEAPVSFSVYTQRGMTRGGTPGDLTNANIGTTGFGVFAYYTIGEGYDAKATPNFMYNQKVTCTGNATPTTEWTYEPVKYWPNEFGSDAQSDEVDQLSFFAYAPWTDIDPTTGNVRVPTGTSTEDAKKLQTLNIISVNKNTATGDPIIKYVVDTDPKTSVDLLWGVAADNAGDKYQPISHEGPAPQVQEGKPFINLVKPNDPANDRLQFNLKHALAKVRVTIDYIDDANTPGGPAAAKINAAKTRIFVRSFKMSGFASKGALNLNNSDTPGEPLWKDYDGVKDLAFDEITFQDGRKDGKEGETNGAQNNETPQGLNEKIIENYSPAANGTFGADKNLGVGAMTTNVVDKVTVSNDAAVGTVLLFGGDPSQNGGYFYVIPRNEGTTPVDVTIAYDIETIDEALAGKLSDGETHGISIENIITKENIFGSMDFRAGYQYDIKIHLGMTSVKIDATVTDWVENGTTDIDLPYNQSTRYNFVSYPDETSQTIWGYGQAQFTGVKNTNGNNSFTQVKVLSNSTDQTVVNKTYWVKSTATSRTELFTDNQGETSAGIWVEIEAVKKYSFKSYGPDNTGNAADQTIVWATGTAETAGIAEIPYGGYQAIKVLSNSEPGDYVGKIYYVATTGNAPYQLYVEKADKSGVEATANPPIWVTFTEITNP
jgi:hypothetical protein